MAGHYRDIASITRGVAILLIILALIAIGFGIYKVAVYKYSDWAPGGVLFLSGMILMGTSIYCSGKAKEALSRSQD